MYNDTLFNKLNSIIFNVKLFGIDGNKLPKINNIIVTKLELYQTYNWNKRRLHTILFEKYGYLLYVDKDNHMLNFMFDKSSNYHTRPGFKLKYH